MSEPSDRRYRVVVHPLAEAEIDEVYDYIIRTHDDSIGAEVWLSGLRRQIRSLSFLPERNPKAGTGTHRPIFRCVYRSHLIYYEVFESELVVQVLYVWHGARYNRPDLARQTP